MASSPKDDQRQLPSSENAEDTPAGNLVQLENGVKATVLSVRGWKARWEAGQTGWTEKDGNVLLRSHLGLVADAKPLRVFVPLCGNAVEMKWLYDLGHTVVGVDVFEGALQKFFKDHDVEYAISKSNNADVTLFQSGDGRIRLYACDLYSFSSVDEKLFDAIWDRGSLVAINRCDREKYAKLLVSLMGPQCRYMLCVVEYDVTIYPGPPHCLTLEDVCGLYEGLGCKVKLLDARDAFEEKHVKWGLSSFDEKLYLISFA